MKNCFGMILLGVILPALANPVLQINKWTTIFPYGCAGIGVDPSNPSTIYVGVGVSSSPSGSGVYKTTDGGSTWTRKSVKITNSGTSYLGNDVFTFVDPSNPKHLYGYTGVANDYGFFVSTNGGDSWSTPQDWFDVQVRVGITSCSGMNDCYGLAADPSNFNHLIVSFHSPWSWCDANFGNAGVVESTNGGQTWIPHPGQSGFGYGNGVGFLYNPTKGIGNKDTWLFGSQGSGYWRTANAGATWTKLNTSNQTHGGCQVYAASNGAFYATANDGILRSSDGGASWRLISSGNGFPSSTGQYFLGLTGDGNNLFTCPSTGGHVLTSPENDGLAWTNLAGADLPNGPHKMASDPVNGIIYASCSDGLWALKTNNITADAHFAVPSKYARNFQLNQQKIISGSSIGFSSGTKIFDFRGKILSNKVTGLKSMICVMKQ